MNEQWLLRRKSADYKSLSKELQLDPVIVRVMVNRGLETADEMRHYLYDTTRDLHDPSLLTDADLAAGILVEKIEEGKRIRIIGDYDIDGIQSTYILWKALNRCGALVDYAVPDRKTDGYGLNRSLIQRAAEDGVDTILTCDNGIAALDAVADAKERGMTVVVTDHHQMPYREENGQRVELVSEADAIVNPHQAGDAYPFKNLCGAGVAYKVILLLYEIMGIPREETDEFLENVGFATIGDVMDLNGENRILAREGLRRLNHTQNLGMRALIRQCGLEDAELKAYHVGFRLGPCLNASGRLDTAVTAIRLLQSTQMREAVPLAQELVELNKKRQILTEQAAAEAFDQVRENGYDQDRVLVVFLPDCDESVAGLVASRLRERYYRPVLVVTRGEKQAKGSGRSIEEYSMFDELSRCRELFTAFGGHPMAAGFSLDESNIPKLRRRLNELTTLTENDLKRKVHIDVDMPVGYVSEQLIEQLDVLEPFGKGNEKPVFCQKNLRICSMRVLGKNQNAVRLELESDQDSNPARMAAVWFGDPEEFLTAVARRNGRDTADQLRHGSVSHDIRMHFCYYPTINEYRGNRTIQLLITSYC